MTLQLTWGGFENHASWKPPEHLLASTAVLSSKLVICYRLVHYFYYGRGIVQKLEMKK